MQQLIDNNNNNNNNLCVQLINLSTIRFQSRKKLKES